ncbi:MAG: DUF4153 domain-containing protein [Opitutaceae bacterium]|nr:DUF4153 domain-containing protein [Opitutaceae bacterium]
MPLKLAELPRGAIEAVRRFPLPVAACVAAYSGVLALINGLTDPYENQVARMLMACALALPLWFALALRRSPSPNPTRFLPDTIGVALIASYGYWLQTVPEDFPFRWGVQFAMLLFAVHCFTACAPFLRGGANEAFWHYNKSLFLRWLLGVLYSVVLFAGLALALLSVDRLLSLDIDDKNYPRLFFGIVTLFHPLFFLAGAPREFGPAPDYPTGLRRFVQFCLVPLVGLYLVILYLYTAKILITWELPNGWVALPVLILAVVGILSALLLDPLRDNAEHSWAGVFIRWFYRLLLPLTVLLLISISVRLNDYGVTENRYIVAVLAGWLFAIAAGYGWLGLRATRWIPLSLGVLCLLGAFGPWSASAVSQRSQSARVMAKLTELGVAQDNKFVANPQTISNEDFDDLRSHLDYLFRMHGADFFDQQMADMPAWKPANDASPSYRYGRANTLLEQLGVSSTQDTPGQTHTFEVILPVVVTTDSQLTTYEFHNHTESNLVISHDAQLTLKRQRNRSMILSHGTETVIINWTAQLQALDVANSAEKVPAHALTQEHDIGGYRVTLTLLRVNYRRPKTGDYEINSGQLLILVQPTAKAGL